jgi:hypothetical protein
MRFLITPEIDGIGIYPCSINARILTKPLLKRPAGQSDFSLLALDHGQHPARCRCQHPETGGVN